MASVASAVASVAVASAPTSQDARRRPRPSVQYADGLLYKCTQCDQMKPVELLQKDTMGSLGCIEECQTSRMRIKYKCKVPYKYKHIKCKANVNTNVNVNPKCKIQIQIQIQMQMDTNKYKHEHGHESNKMVVGDVQLCLLGGSATNNFNVAASSTAIAL